MQSTAAVKPLTEEQIALAYFNFPYFHNVVFPFSFTGGSHKFVGGQHLNNWCAMLQTPNTCILAPRKHSKSMTIYSWLMWRNWRKADENYEVLYLSYKKELASYHIKKYKDLVANNPIYREMRDMTQAEGIARYTWDGKHQHIIEPEGILSFKRGRHPDDVILDDILSDPTEMLDLGVIEKINERVKEDVFSLPREGGQIKIIGTAQTPIDFFFDLKDNPDFKWGIYPAIQNHIEKKVLWPQQFPWERLQQLRNFIGDKAFQKEYMLQPVWSADSFFRREQLDPHCINPELRNVLKLQTKNEVGMGWDIGKHSHPAHISIFEFVPLGKGIDTAIMRYQEFMDGWEYHKQLDHVKALVDGLRVDYVNYDNTRGELEGYFEKGFMDRSKFFPITFNSKMKNQMAAEFEARVTRLDEQGKPNPLIMLQNNERMINQILVVTNGLEAIQTHEGHGDSFWSIALALYKKARGEMFILQDPDNLSGLF